MPLKVYKVEKPFCTRRMKSYLLQSEGCYTFRGYKCMFFTLKYYSLFNLNIIHGSSKMLQGSNFGALISGDLFVGFKQVISLCGSVHCSQSVPTTLQSSK